MKHYEEEFLRDGYREVLCYGIAFWLKNFDYPEKTLKYKHIRRISD